MGVFNIHISQEKKKNAGVKIIWITVLIFLMLIPLGMLKSLVYERSRRKENAGSDLNIKWGGEQEVAGPILSIPYEYTAVRTDNDKTKTKEIRRKYLHVLPEQLNIESTPDVTVRYRGIYQFNVYTANIKLTGTFRVPEKEKFISYPERIFYNKALVVLGINQLKGISDDPEFIITINDTVKHDLSFSLKTQNISIIHAGLTNELDFELIPNKEYDFEISFVLKGRGSLKFAPVGKETKAIMKSSWPHPSFTGNYLPTYRDISESGFTGEWNIYHLSRNFPQILDSFENYGSTLGGALFGTEFYMPVDIYDKSMRTLKYGIMFLLLTFALFFLFENLTGLNLHPIQYLLTGAAIIVFYLLQLSLSEHVGFNTAYILGAASITGLITYYAAGFLKNKHRVLVLSLLMVLLYTVLYIILQSQDYALLLGTLLIFAFLAVVMIVTRKTDWSNLTTPSSKIEKEN